VNRTPFDDLVDDIRRRGYHNQRLEDHSDIITDGILRDLLQQCAPLRADFEAGTVRAWKNVPSPGDRKRKIDLLVAEPGEGGRAPDLETTRLGIENKSVVTAHRNKTSRFDDLTKLLGAYQSNRPETVLVATVIVGTASRYLNVCDRIAPFHRDRFDTAILPRLSSGDETLWSEFPPAVSMNRPQDPAQTIEHFRSLPTRPPGMTHRNGYDYVLLVPMHIDNVQPPFVDRTFGGDHDDDYRQMITTVCKAYTARWHMR
jgi:hypothetical protein